MHQSKLNKPRRVSKLFLIPLKTKDPVVPFGSCWILSSKLVVEPTSTWISKQNCEPFCLLDKPDTSLWWSTSTKATFWEDFISIRRHTSVHLPLSRTRSNTCVKIHRRSISVCLKLQKTWFDSSICIGVRNKNHKPHVNIQRLFGDAFFVQYRQYWKANSQTQRSLYCVTTFDDRVPNLPNEQHTAPRMACMHFSLWRTYVCEPIYVFVMMKLQISSKWSQWNF